MIFIIVEREGVQSNKQPKCKPPDEFHRPSVRTLSSPVPDQHDRKGPK
jgi:hypothetical protein